MQANPRIAYIFSESLLNVSKRNFGGQQLIIKDISGKTSCMQA